MPLQRPGLGGLRGAAAAAVCSLVMVLWLMQGCKQDRVPTGPSMMVTDDDAADILASWMGGPGSTGGFTTQIGEAAAVAGGGHLTQSVAADTIILRTDSVAGSSYSFRVHYQYNFANLGDVLNFSFDSRGIFETQRLSGTDTAIGVLQVLQIQSTADSLYVMSGSYSRAGSEYLKIRNSNHFLSNMTSTWSDLRVLKSTGEVRSGTGAINFWSEGSDSLPHEFTVTVSFLGSQQAAIAVDDKQYQIDLAAGKATPVAAKWN